MKKILSLICVLLAICLLTACTNTLYVPQKNISLNYNNLSAGNYSNWLENDFLVYSERGHLGEYIYRLKTENDNPLLSSTPIGSTEIVQTYKDYIYYTVRGNSTQNDYYENTDIVQYDTTTQTGTYITTASNLSEFFADATHLYLMRWQEKFNETYYVLDVISLETQEIIAQISDVYTCGMRNGVFTFLKDTENGFEVFEYHPQTKKSEKIATITLPITNDITIHETINFTNEVMILEAFLTESNASQILIYEFISGALKTIDTPYDLDEIIAYENNAFCILSDWEADKYFLYSLNLDTFELLQLGRIGDDKSLFVTSDEDVYLCGWDDEIVHYNLDGTKEQVLVKEKK